MLSQTTEHAFESYVEDIFFTRGGWRSGSTRSRTNSGRSSQPMCMAVNQRADAARQEGRDYEPASVLFERIRAERASAETKPATRAKPAKASKPRRR